MQKNKKELANIPAEQLAQQLEQHMQTEEGAAELAPYLQAFEKEMKNSPMGMMYADGGSIFKKDLNIPTKYPRPLFNGIPSKERPTNSLDIDAEDALKEQRIKEFFDILEQQRNRMKHQIPPYNDSPIQNRFKNKF